MNKCAGTCRHCLEKCELKKIFDLNESCVRSNRDPFTIDAMKIFHPTGCIKQSSGKYMY